MRTALLIGCILLAPGGNLLLKHGMNQMGSVSETTLGIAAYIVQTALKPQIIVGVVFYIASFAMWLALLSMMEISAVYPIFVSCAFLIVMSASAIWFGEHVTLLRALGTAVVAAGIYLVSKGG